MIKILAEELFIILFSATEQFFPVARAQAIPQWMQQISQTFTS